MTEYPKFSDALAEWRGHGGAIVAIATTPQEIAQGHPDLVWFVGEADEIENKVSATAKDATIGALKTGGLTDKQIQKEMIDWQD